jgi:histone-lysine N-methyltransferase SETMAR
MIQDNKQYFRSIVLNYYKTGMNALKIFKTLKSIYGNECPSYAFVAKWRRRFMSGQTTIKDEPRQGRPMKHEDGKYDEKILKLIKEDPYISVNDIAKLLGFSNTKTKNYIKKNLNLKKTMCKWVPHLLTDNQKKERVNFCKYFLEKYANKNEKNIYNIITGDETWVRFWDPKVGNNAKIWKLNGDDNIEKRIKSIRDEKIMVSVFFTKAGINSVNILNKN